MGTPKANIRTIGTKISFRNVTQMPTNMLIGTAVKDKYLRMKMKLSQEDVYMNNICVMFGLCLLIVTQAFFMLLSQGATVFTILAINDSIKCYV